MHYWKKSERLSQSLLAFDGDRVVRRLEYHTYICIQDMYKLAYVNWLYVLPAYRHKGIAQKLFKSFEKICKESNVNQYFLIRANNKNANKFYDSLIGAQTDSECVLRKTIM